MGAIKILIVEDESLIAEDIALKLTNSGYEVTATVDNCEAAIESAKTNQPDIAFLDIEITGEKDGIETAKGLREIGNVAVIFLTKFYDTKMIQKAMAVKPANYLNKPFTEHQLYSSIQMAIYNTVKDREVYPGETASEKVPESLLINDTFYLKDTGGTFQKFNIHDILYIKAGRAYCDIYTKSGKFMQTVNMKSIGEKMGHPKLVQAHRSYIVNIDAIEAVKGNTLIIDKEEIPVGGDYKETIFKRLQLIR